MEHIDIGKIQTNLTKSATKGLESNFQSMYTLILIQIHH